jgi:hypothetical protein
MSKKIRNHKTVEAEISQPSGCLEQTHVKRYKDHVQRDVRFTQRVQGVTA